MGFGEAISSCLSKFVTFSGRAPRSEYWYFYLFFMLVIVMTGVIDGALGPDGGGVGTTLFFATILILFIPQLSVTVRRLHDLDRSGWWWWLALVPLVGGIILLVWFCTKGTEGNNSYGPDPLNPVPVAVFD